MSEVELTKEQSVAVDTVIDWYRTGAKPTLTLGGYAGTGKTTILGMLPGILTSAVGHEAGRDFNIAFCSYTGKAVSVLQSKLPGDAFCTTLHRLLYKPRPINVCSLSGDPVNLVGTYCESHANQPLKNPEIVKIAGCPTKRKLDWSHRENPLEGLDLVVVDEASMVSDKIWADLTRYRVPVLAVGDHGQLEPIKSEFNLMADPEIRLETVLRQVADSPIVRMSILAREEGRIPQGDYGGNCVKLPRHQLMRIMRKVHPERGDLVLCAYNRTRNDTNAFLRKLAGRSGPVQVGDVVICLRNSYENAVFNGQRGTVSAVGDYTGDALFLSVALETEDYEVAGEVFAPQFEKPKTLSDTARRFLLFDYGYTLTVHKAQGSEANRVVVVEEHLPSVNYNRWLYTAVTRAKRDLCLIGGK